MLELIAYVNELPAMRQSVLKVSAKIFDPLGLVSPFIVRLKILFQKLCIEWQTWDESLVGNVLKHCNQFTNELSTLEFLDVTFCQVQFLLIYNCMASVMHQNMHMQQ